MEEHIATHHLVSATNPKSDCISQPTPVSLPFWQAVDELVSSHEIIIDRPRGSAHPRYPDKVYPFDYGHLEGTSSNDGGGIDVWVGTLEGTLEGKHVSAAIVTVDLHKHDAEIKILLDCTPDEKQVILDTHNLGRQSAILIERQVKRPGSRHA